MSHAYIPEIMASLPLETRCPPYPIRQYGGFWLPEIMLRGVAAAHACFEPRPTDILLASFPKSGTTWLKALAFATLNRATHSPFDSDHPLNHRNPHDCVSFLEINPKLADSSYTASASDLFDALPSPRLLSTHMPCSLLPRRITEAGVGGRLVYICREPKDVLVSLWLFNMRTAATLQLAAGMQPSLLTFTEAFEMFCEGRCVGGPHWCHALEYWTESKRRPDKVLFLSYEEMLQDPVGNLKKLAAFMGCAFREEEEEAGVLTKIVELCSMDKLKGMDVNKNGTTLLGLKNEAFFRKGTVGDWNNHMTPEMAARLDRIVEGALQGSGLTFAKVV